MQSELLKVGRRVSRSRCPWEEHALSIAGPLAFEGLAMRELRTRLTEDGSPRKH